MRGAPRIILWPLGTAAPIPDRHSARPATTAPGVYAAALGFKGSADAPRATAARPSAGLRTGFKQISEVCQETPRSFDSESRPFRRYFGSRLDFVIGDGFQVVG